MKITKMLVDMLVENSSDIYVKFVIYEKNKKVIYVKILKVIYKMLINTLLFYFKLKKN